MFSTDVTHNSSLLHHILHSYFVILQALNRTEYNLKPEWITTQKCLEADGKGKQTYIFDPFEGVAFEHIKNCGYRFASDYNPLLFFSHV